MNTPRRPTLDTVARATGVSRTTVSNAYNRPDQLSRALRDRILRAAGDLGYSGPDPLARGLATRRSAAVAVLLPAGLGKAFSDPALLVVLDALAATLDARDHALVLLPGHAGAPRPERVTGVAADVAIAYGLPDGTPAISAAQGRGLPLVLIDSPDVPGWPTVRVDDRSGAAAAARHVLDLGHRVIGILSFETQPDGRSGPATVGRVAAATYRVTRDRLAGFQDELRTSSATPAPPVWETSANTSGLGRTGAHRLLTREPRPTALLCTSDELAMGALQAARDLGLSVPGELSVVGFDDIPAAALADPPLTTLRQPLAGKGRTAAELTLRLLDGNPTPSSVHLPTELIVRGSTASAATRTPG